MKKTIKLMQKIFLVVLVLIIAFGVWLPEYNVDDLGAKIENQPDQVFECLLATETWDKLKAKVAPEHEQLSMDDKLEFLGQKFVVSDLEMNEFMNFSGHPVSISFELEPEAAQTWLTISTENQLGKNPFKKLYDYFFDKQLKTSTQIAISKIAQICKK